MHTLPDLSATTTTAPTASRITPVWPALTQPRFWLLTALVAGAVAARWLPHPPNFTPIGALALFAGALYADRRYAFALPLTALFLSDLLIGLHILIPVVYASFALNVLLGRWLRQHWKVANLAAVTLLGSVQFFLTTNFACWIIGYPHTLQGLLDCYFRAIPFFRNTLLGDLTFVVVLFGSVALVERVFPVLKERPQQLIAT